LRTGGPPGGRVEPGGVIPVPSKRRMPISGSASPSTVLWRTKRRRAANAICPRVRSFSLRVLDAGPYFSGLTMSQASGMKARVRKNHSSAPGSPSWGLFFVQTIDLVIFFRKVGDSQGRSTASRRPVDLSRLLSWLAAMMPTFLPPHARIACAGPGSRTAWPGPYLKTASYGLRGGKQRAPRSRTGRLRGKQPVATWSRHRPLNARQRDDRYRIRICRPRRSTERLRYRSPEKLRAGHPGW
jgi:hypothetical protein